MDMKAEVSKEGEDQGQDDQSLDSSEILRDEMMYLGDGEILNASDIIPPIPKKT